VQHVLLIEDDSRIREIVERGLGARGLTVTSAPDGLAGVDLVSKLEVDVVLLDLMLPGMPGLEVLEEIRAIKPRLPVVALTALDDTRSKVAGLDAGADDYLVKPFALEELLARLRALLRRSEATADEVLTLGDLTLSPGSRLVQRAGAAVELTRTEFNLLELLLRNAGQVLTRELILDRVWGYDFQTTSNSLEVYVGYLRRKTEAAGGDRLIHTVRGVGYVARIN
jgi:two-component system response regulator MprA